MASDNIGEILKLSRISLGDSTKNLRSSFLHAASAATRYLSNSQENLLSFSEHSYSSIHHPHLSISTSDKKKRENIFSLMKNYLSIQPNDIAQFIVNHIEYTLARSRMNFDDMAAYLATAYSVRDRLIEYWNDSQYYYRDNAKKICCYLSIEYLPGRALANAIFNMGLKDPYHAALKILGYHLEDLYDLEQDAALGNGGLGRLAACYLDSMATLNLPAWGYGLRYRYGMFKQSIKDGYQHETPDYWLGAGNPWEIARLGKFYPIQFRGRSIRVLDNNGNYKYIWEADEIINAQAYDNPVPGYRTRNVTNLRLWESVPASEINFSSFNAGDYDQALDSKQSAEQITSVLYPNDSTPQGRTLRLKQQYFFVSATMQDIQDRFISYDLPWSEFPNRVSIQLNDTHPSVAIAELMRLLLDVHNIQWDEAWDITCKTFSYTNHTVLPEAMEKWDINLFGYWLPRHLEIIFEINARFMDFLEKRYPGDCDKKSRLSIFEEGYIKRIRMTHLAIITSHKVNGVAVIHSDILKNSLFKEFYELYPEKFINVTNGITPRRWMGQSNLHLSELISSTIGSDNWLSDLNLLKSLKKYATDTSFQKKWAEARYFNKVRLTEYIRENYAIRVDPTAIFDIQIKRIHEYKRQLLNVFSIIYRYLHLKKMTPEKRALEVPRINIFGGKAAPGYYRAKLIIKLINQIAQIINSDSETNTYLKVIYLANYNVSLAELVVCACDVSEHISTAGTEASGTSNMKFALNGGLILGTFDGANIEIKDSIGIENMFLFGAKAEEVSAIRSSSCEIDHRLYDALQAINNNIFGNAGLFKELTDPIWNGNDYYILAHDFPLYLAAQENIDKVWRDTSEWNKRSILTTSGMGFFSSDRAIKEYAENIWHISPCSLSIPVGNTKTH